MQRKRCSTCKRRRSLRAFNRHCRSPDGYASQCRDCRRAGRGKKTGHRTCSRCGRTFFTKNTATLCSKRCISSLASERQKGSNNPNWRGGEIRSAKGYVYILKHDHPRAMKNGYVKKADLVVETALGRILRDDEVVHHKNRIREDDRLENLQVLTVDAHRKLHTDARRRPRRLRLPKKIVTWPSATELRSWVAASSLRVVARHLGCSHVAVFHRLRKLKMD